MKRRRKGGCGGPAGGRIRWDSNEAIAERKSRLPLGPASLEELNDWPRTNAIAICSRPEQLLRLRANMLRGVVVYSDYSGFCSEKEALIAGWSAMQKAVGLPLRGCPFRFDRTCDIEPLPLKLLCHISESQLCGKMCVHKDIIDRLHRYARRHCESQAPDPATSSRKEAAQAYEKMLEWLIANKNWVLQDEQECLVHKTHCPTHPRMKMQQEEDLGGDKICDKIFMYFAGVSCDGWSSIGRQERFAHCSELAHNVYIAERSARADMEDLSILECTQNYPVDDKLRKPLESSHTVVSVISGPELFGHPVHRRRVFAACISKARYIWVGPSDSDALDADFEALFYRAAQLGGSAYFADSEDSRLRMYQAMAASQTNRLSMDQLRRLPDDELLELILPVGQLNIAKQWHADREMWEADCGELCVDLEHNVTERPRGGHLWPTQLSHGTIAHMPRDGRIRIATPLEHLGAQGFRVFCKDPSPMCRVINGRTTIPGGGCVSKSAAKALIGRGVHITVLSAWMNYIRANMIPIRKANIAMLRGLTLHLEGEGGGSGPSGSSSSQAAAGAGDTGEEDSRQS